MLWCIRFDRLVGTTWYFVRKKGIGSVQINRSILTYLFYCICCTAYRTHRQHHYCFFRHSVLCRIKLLTSCTLGPSLCNQRWSRQTSSFRVILCSFVRESIHAWPASFGYVLLLIVLTCQCDVCQMSGQFVTVLKGPTSSAIFSLRHLSSCSMHQFAHL